MINRQRQRSGYSKNKIESEMGGPGKKKGKRKQDYAGGKHESRTKLPSTLLLKVMDLRVVVAGMGARLD